MTAATLDLVKQTTGASILYDTGGLRHLRETHRHASDGSARTLPESQQLYPMSVDILAAVDRVMTTSAEAAEIISAAVPDAHVTVIPPCVTLREDDDLCESPATGAVRLRISRSQARRILLGLLGDDVCPICGTRPIRPQTTRQSEWRESMSCMTCLAPNRSAALAQVLLVPFHRQRANSLREALLLFDTLRIHEFNDVAPVMPELSNLRRFTASRHRDGARSDALSPDELIRRNIQTSSFGDASIDLLISQDVSDPDSDFPESFRMLRPGGRYVFTISGVAKTPVFVNRTMPDDGLSRDPLPPQHRAGRPNTGETPVRKEPDLVDRLRGTGFDVEIHTIGDPQCADRQILVFETTRPLRHLAS